MNEFDFLKNAKDDIPEDIRIYVKKSMDILDHLHELMEEKNINQRQLADKMGKKEAEVSKWLNGVQNFTLKTLSKLEAALEGPIVLVPTKKFRELSGITIIESKNPENKSEHNFFDFRYKNSGLVQKDTLAA